MTGHFEVKGWTLEGERRLAFAYKSSKFGAFTEVVEFPEARLPLSMIAQRHSALLDVASVVLGVSYYKADPVGSALLKRRLTPEAMRFARALYIEGLGEFYVRNGLPYPPDFEFRPPADGAAPPGSGATAAPSSARAVAAFGGGKDSHVALALLERAGIPTEPTAVVLSEASARRLGAMSTRRLTLISRRIDPALLAANRSGALNGHVPITAINSLILVIYALLQEANWVVFANERSADEPTMTVGGHEINHQFSKTYHCERLLRDCLQSISPAMPEYFSVLRPVSELWIARVLASLPDALNKFSSCNRNFVFAGPKALPTGVRWCGECAKCAFTALITAPFLSRAASIEVFGSDILDNDANSPLIRELVGMSEAKPWDCVGTVREAAAALSRLGRDDNWKHVRAVSDHIASVRARWGETYLDEAFGDAMTCHGNGFLPPNLALECGSPE